MLHRMQRILKDLNSILQDVEFHLTHFVSAYNRSYDYAMKRPIFCAQFTLFPLIPIKKLSFKDRINQYLSTALIAKA